MSWRNYRTWIFQSTQQFRRFVDRTLSVSSNTKKYKVVFIVVLFTIIFILDPRNLLYGSLWRNTKEALMDPYFITIHCNTGRLGNQMGTYAALYGLARLNNRLPYGQPCNMVPLLPYFDLSVAEIGTLPKHSQRQYEIGPYLRPQDKTIPPNKNILSGYKYPSSFTFYDHVRSEIKREFQFKNHLVEYAQNLLYSIDSNGDALFIGVHVRKTDYCTWLNAFKGKEVGRDYIIKAMKYFRKKYHNVIFVVVSDDRKWCKKELSALPNVVITEEPLEPAYDLAVLANCNHSIITYGTFGFWGAYLAGGETIYYSDFLAPDSEFLLSEVPYNKTYLPEWIGMTTVKHDFWIKNNSEFRPKECEDTSWWKWIFG